MRTVPHADGFGGNSTVESNLLFNAVRETGDHGPINSYDRQPFFTLAHNGATPSYAVRESTITSNFIISNYLSKVPIDHDDGSSFSLPPRSQRPASSPSSSSSS